MLKFALLVSLLSLSIGIARSSRNSSLYRLPKNVSPEAYSILLLTNVTAGDFNYKGQVNVKLLVKEVTDRVVMHADKLTVLKEKTVLRKNDDDLPVIGIADQCYDADTQFYTIKFSTNLIPGSYLLTLEFLGEVLDDVFGFYRTSYKVNNEIRWLGVTQFSTTYARRAFPCMDEPGFKATFQLSIGHYGNETVISNTLPELKNKTDRYNYYITRFARTSVMSTYILAWAIHDFNRINSTNPLYPQFSLWTRYNDSELPSSLSKSPILVEGPKIYQALDNLMGIRSPSFYKFQQFAVPDFHFNAMENWGMITYREGLPLIWYETTPLTKIYSSLATVGHEYSHTWFGNIVTPVFWDYAWLKEGFATYFSYLGISIVHNDWRMMELFTTDVLQISMLKDSEEHNRTMNGRDVGSPASVLAAMDFVTYEKGASVIRMIADIVTEKTFRTAMRSYLKEMQYKATTPLDVYRHLKLALNATSKPPTIPVGIDEIFESWTNQPNYPLVRVFHSSPGRLRVSQEPFVFNRSKLSENDNRFWWIQVKIAVSPKTNDKQLTEISTWLGSNKSTTIELPGAATDIEWYILNPQQVGFYRVDYDTENWNSLKLLLNSDKYTRISSVNRAALLDDAFNLARGGYEPYSLPLDLARYLTREDDYVPWIAAARALRFLDVKLGDKSNVQEAIRRYAIDLITPIYKELSFKEDPLDSRVKRMQRSLILSTACSMNLGDCVSNAKSIFDNWIADENKPVPANLKNFVYRVGVVNGTEEDWMNLWERFLETDFHSEKEPLINALAATDNPSLINKFLEFAIQPDSDIAKQYRHYIVQAIVAENKNNIDTTLDYLQSNLKKIIKLRSATFLESILTAIGKEVTSTTQENKLTRFVNRNANLLGSALEAGKNAIKSARDNIAWIDNSVPQIDNYFGLKN